MDLDLALFGPCAGDGTDCGAFLGDGGCHSGDFHEMGERVYSGINESVDKRVKMRTNKGLGIRQ